MIIGYKRGQTSIVLRLKVLDSSVSTGAGKTGLTSSSAGLIISTIADNESTATAYTQAGSTIESITTLGTYAAPTATKCRFKEVDATNHPGVYEIQLADARFAVASAKSLLVSLSGAANAAQTDVVIPLRDLDPYDSVRAGLTALPNAAAGANGGLPLGDANARVDVSKFAGSALTQSGGRPEVNTTHVAGTSQTAGDIIGDTNDIQARLPAALAADGSLKASLQSILGTAFTEGAAGRIAAAFKQFFNIATPAATMDHLILVDTATAVTNRVTANTDQIEGVDATNQIRDSILSDATRFAGANVDAAITSRLAPTVAGRTLDVSATGEAGMDLANVGSPTTVVNLSGVTIKTATDVETDTQDIQSRLPAALTADGNIKADALRIGGTLQTGGDIYPKIDTEIADIQSRLPAALVGGRIDASVGAMANDVVTAAAIAADAIGSSELAGSAVTEIQTGLSTLDAAGVRAAVGLASANLDTQLTAIDDYIDTEIAAIKAKTDNLPANPASTGDVTSARDSVLTILGTPAGADMSTDIAAVKSDTAAVKAKTDNLPTDPADASDIAAAFGTVNTTLGTIAGYIDTEVAAIKAKTDNLPASPASTSDVTGARDAVQADIAALNDLSAAEVNAEVDAALADYDGPTHAELTAELATADDATLAAIALIPAAVRDVDNSAPAAGSLGAAVNTSASEADPDAISAAVGGEAIEGAYTRDDLLRGLARSLLGKGAGTAAKPFRDLADTKDSISAEIASDGERTDVDLDLA